jgi:hypothetical protein
VPEKTLTELYQDLVVYKDFSSSENNVELFQETVAKILNLKELSSIKKILLFFKDDSIYEWVFEGIIRGIENRFSDEDYVTEILKNFYILDPQAVELGSSIIIRILNHNDCRTLFLNYIHLAQSDSLIKILDYIAEEYEAHQELIREIKKTLKE